MDFSSSASLRYTISTRLDRGHNLAPFSFFNLLSYGPPFVLFSETNSRAVTDKDPAFLRYL
jgi:flavin reductase (DIM6/NTAB) family NADH-FMN oxidoreductase RutF